MTRITGAVLAVCALATANPCVARPLPPGDPLDRWRDDLELTDEQAGAIDELRYTARQEEITCRAALERAELDLEREMGRSRPDESTVMRLFEHVHKARGDMEKVHLRTRIRIRAILTPQQRQRLEDCMRKERPPRAPRPPKKPEALGS